MAAADKPESVTAVMVLGAVVLDPLASVMVTPPSKTAPTADPVEVDSVGPVVGVLNTIAVATGVAATAPVVDRVIKVPLIFVMVATVPIVVDVMPTAKFVFALTVIEIVPAAAVAAIGTVLVGLRAVPAAEVSVGILPAKPDAMEEVITVEVAVAEDGAAML